MKIAFVGKGGSGKTTMAALFSRFLASQGKTVLAIDADINQHFGQALGFSDAQIASVPALGHVMPEVRNYFRGTNPRIAADATFRMTTPPGNGSKLVKGIARDPFVERYSVASGPLRFMTTGDFEDKDVGMICYHGKTMATEIFLNHLIDGRDEYVVVDMTAGADAFSTGIFFKFDLLMLVVEPTRKSLDVYRQYKEFLHGTGIRLAVIANKIMSDEDETFIRSEVGEDLICRMPVSASVRKADRGEMVPFESYEAEVQAACSQVKTALDETPKDWNAFYARLVELHQKHAVSWLNDSFKQDFTLQIDPDFSLAEAAKV